MWLSYTQKSHVRITGHRCIIRFPVRYPIHRLLPCYFMHISSWYDWWYSPDERKQARLRLRRFSACSHLRGGSQELSPMLKLESLRWTLSASSSKQNIPGHRGKWGWSWIKKATSFTRSEMGAFASDSFQQRDIASKWTGSKVWDHVSIATLTSSYERRDSHELSNKNEGWQSIPADLATSKWSSDRIYRQR